MSNLVKFPEREYVPTTVLYHQATRDVWTSGTQCGHVNVGFKSHKTDNAYIFDLTPEEARQLISALHACINDLARNGHKADAAKLYDPGEKPE